MLDIARIIETNADTFDDLPSDEKSKFSAVEAVSRKHWEPIIAFSLPLTICLRRNYDDIWGD